MTAKNERAPRVMVKITRDLIEESKERDSSHCMIAQAVKLAHPNAANVSVDIQTIRFSDRRKRRRYVYMTPRIAQVGLIDFDQGHTPEPFEFQLRNGQITLSGSRQDRQGEEKKPRTEAQKAHDQALAKARLVKRQEKDNGEVPDKLGGRTPPTTPFARRRAFGLRALER